jgi:hypothetical protein
MVEFKLTGAGFAGFCSDGDGQKAVWAIERLEAKRNQRR